MPGIADAGNSLGHINPQDLIGNATPVVEPRAVAQLTDAFRQGVITSEDIHDRIGELGQTKRKAEIDIAKRTSAELNDPALMQARRQTQLAAGSQAQLAGNQAQAALPLVQPTADLAAQQIETQQQTAKYPTAAIFDQMAPGYGLETPMTADGKIDWPKKAKIGAQIALHDVERREAKSKLDNIQTHVSADGTVLSAFTKQGQPVTPEEVRTLQERANKPFQLVTPGTASIVPASVAPVSLSNAAPGTVFGAASSESVPQDKAAGLDAQLSAMLPNAPVVQPKSAPAKIDVTSKATTPTMGTVIPGVGASLGAKAAPADKAPTEAQQRAQLALSRFSQSNDMLGSLKASGYNPASIGSWMNSLLPEIAKSGDRKMYDAAVNAWSQGLLRLESGAAISRNEQKWYNQAFFPQVGDPQAVVTQKEALRHDAERMVAEIAQAGNVDSPESIAQTKRLYANANSLVSASPQAAAQGSGPIVTLPNGKKVQRDANGQYFQVQ